MKRLSKWGFDEIIAYNLRDNGTAFTIFADVQPGRISIARNFIDEIVAAEGRRLTITELGCSAGDIAGWYAKDHEAIGIDVTPAAVASARERYPDMTVIHAAVEEVEPHPTDVLVLCEFLEHIVDPIGLVRAWMPLAKYTLIGHPLVGDGDDAEQGHLWGYNDADFLDWWRLGEHELVKAVEFLMGYRFVLGYGRHKGSA